MVPRGPSPSPMNPMYHQPPSSSSSSTTTSTHNSTPFSYSHIHHNGSSSSTHLSPYSSSQTNLTLPHAAQTSHPSIPPRSALRVNTDFARSRSNSSAVIGARVTPRPLDLGANPGGLNHQFSRSMSHSSPLSPGLVSAQPEASVGVGAREGRDVFMAVRNLRGGVGDQAPSPTSPIHDLSGNSDFSFRGGGNGVAGQFADANRSEVMIDDEEGDEADTLEKLKMALRKSNDSGNTLDLSRRGMRQIGPKAVEVFRKGVGQDQKGVWRLALSYNSLRDYGIDFSFSRLGRLRYLNLKGNNFTIFPLALTEMPALEILDLSKNHINTFPDRPGRLIYLKVLSLTSNKIMTLPTYLTQFEALKVFKVDNNPIEWPPKEVLGALVDGESTSRDREESGTREKKREEDLRPWIENMKSWMRQRVAGAELSMETNGVDEPYTGISDIDSARTILTTESSNADTEYSPDSPATRITSQQTVRPSRESPPVRAASPAPSSRSTRPKLGLRSRSTTLSTDTVPQSLSPTRPPPLQIPTPHSRKPSVTSPPASALSITSSIHSRQSSINAPPPVIPPIPASVSHNRGASYTATQRLSASLASKKSLPDLRQSHAKIIQERRDSGNGSVEIRTLGLGIKTPVSARMTPVPPPPWTAELTKSPSAASFLTEKDKLRSLSRKGSADMLRRVKGSAGPGSPMAEKRGGQEGPLVDDSRNSYFRRLSTLPISSISKAIPSSLLRCVDAIRGILFALSQLHSALRQYLVFAVSDRVANLFSKVMDPASGRMTDLINALDRFDSMSRRGTPPVSAIRGVMEATRDSIVTFGKVVAVLRLQMPAVKGTDVRYTRTLLLMIYGSMAEVSYSWTAMAPLIAEMKLVLAGDAQGVAMRAILGGVKMVPSASFLGRTPISPIPERGESHSPPSVRTERQDKSMGNSPLHQSTSAVDPSLSPTPTPASSRGAKNRRQAGSFSTQDVQRGMKMVGQGQGSPVAETQNGGGRGRHESSGSANSLLPRTEESDAEDDEAKMLSAMEDDELDTMLPNPPFALRAGVSNSSTINLPQTPPEHSAVLQPVTMVPTTSHSSRRGHHGPSSSSGSSHMAQQYGYGIPRKLSVDIRPPTPASAATFDEDLLDVIESATEVAFTAWLRLAEDVGASSPPSTKPHQKSPSQSSLSSGPYSASDSRRPSTITPRHYSELLDLLSSSEVITTTLRECVMAIRANPNSPSQYSQLHLNAQSFVKTVVKVTELIMNISSIHTFPSAVKNCCARLVQFTREFAILFSVSNIRPSTSASMRSLSSAANGRSISPMPFSARSGGSGGSGFRLGSGGSGPAVGFGQTAHTPRSGSGGYSVQQRGGYGGAESSNEDLLAPHSAHTPGSGNWNGPPSAGLRGLQLPSRQAALAKRRAGATGASVPVR